MTGARAENEFADPPRRRTGQEPAKRLVDGIVEFGDGRGSRSGGRLDIIFRLELRHLRKDHLGHGRLGADGPGVPEPPAVFAMRIGVGLFLDVMGQAEQHRNVLEGMEAVGNEERHDDDIGAVGQRAPILHERLLFHQHGLAVAVGFAGAD